MTIRLARYWQSIDITMLAAAAETLSLFLVALQAG